MTTDNELILRLLLAPETKALYRLWVKRLHRAQTELEQAQSVEDIRRAQGRIEELRYMLKLKAKLKKKSDTA